MKLTGKRVLITGSAKRIGRSLAFAVARAGGEVILHHSSSPQEALQVKSDIEGMGSSAHILQADFTDPNQAESLLSEALGTGPLFALVNNAAIFEALDLTSTNLEDWERHLSINLTAPFMLSKTFAASIDENASGRIINILDWRALRPGADHLPYTISKAGLAALTKSLAVALAPRIIVNGLALGAILPPSTGAASDKIIEVVPAGRWAKIEEVEDALIFLLTGPEYITGEIIHIDGGRHLV